MAYLLPVARVQKDDGIGNRREVVDEVDWNPHTLLDFRATDGPGSVRELDRTVPDRPRRRNATGIDRCLKALFGKDSEKTGKRFHERTFVLGGESHRLENVEAAQPVAHEGESRVGAPYVAGQDHSIVGSFAHWGILAIMAWVEKGSRLHGERQSVRSPDQKTMSAISKLRRNLALDAS